MPKLTAEQQRLYDDTVRMLVVDAGIDPAMARISALNKIDGVVTVDGFRPAVKHNGRQREPFEEPPIPRARTALELMESDMEPISYLCEPWIPEGLGILAARPKLGKTTLLRQKLAAVAGAGELFRAQCTQATCLFLSLEEGDRLTRAKFEMAGFTEAALASILIHFKWRRGTEGVLDLQRALDANASIKYVGIDSLTRFRDVPDARTPAFAADYEAVSALHAVAKARPGVCIELVHHTRKAKSEDPIEDISGTFGIAAACDWFSIMRHHEDGAVLHVGGRLWEHEETKFQLSRANQRWELVGEFTGLTSAQTATLNALRVASGLTPSQLAATFGTGRQAAFERLGTLVKRGFAYSKDGQYFAKDHSHT